MRKTMLVAALLAVTLMPVVASHAATTLTYVDILHQLTNLDRLTRYQPGVTGGQYSSWDRNEHKVWGSNGDCGQYLRVEKDGEAVMMDQDGPGCIYRIWSANPQGKIRFYIDGATKPTYEFDFNSIFTGAVPPFIQPLVWKRGGVTSGSDCYLPIPFAKHIKVTADKAWNQYYHIDYLRFPSDWKVPSFRLPLTGAEETALNAASKAWSQPGRDPKAPMPRQRTITRSLTLPAGGHVRLADLTGPGCIRAIRATVSCDQRYFWRKIVLRGAWDGAKWPQVLAPLGPFFGFDWYTADYGSLIAGCQHGHCYFYYPMPFHKSAVLDLKSFLERPARVTFEIEWAPERSLPANSMYFFARWRHEARPWTFDYPWLETAGQGQFVGVSLSVDHPSPGWWGEGDEKVWIDNDQFPSWIGTGSEDYFGDAWGIRYLPGPSWGCSYDKGARTCPYRWQFMDHIPFAKRFRMTIEDYPPLDKEYSSVAYWYQTQLTPPFDQLRGATYIGAKQPGVPPSEQHYDVDIFHDITAADLRTTGLDLRDAVEAEKVLAPAVKAGKARIVDDALLPFQFNKERAVDFGGVKAGQTLADFHLPVPESNVYYLKLYTAPVEGLADLTVEVGGQELDITGRPAKNCLALSGVYLAKGDHTAHLIAATAGRGLLDCFQLAHAARAQGAIEAEDLPVVKATGGGPLPHPSPPWQGASAGRVLEYHATAPGQGFVLRFANPPALPYVLGVRPMFGPQAGIVQAFVAGKAIGPSFDLYAPDKHPGPAVLPLGSLPKGAGDVEIRVVGKNPRSGGYHLGLDYFRWEPLIINPKSAAGVWAYVARTRGCEYRIQNLGAEWLGSHQLWLEPSSRGALVDLALHIPRDGDYDITVRYTTAHDYAIVQASLDGKALGAPFDCYTPAVLLSKPVDLGRVHLTAGMHSLAFKAVGKNPAAANYLMGIDYVLVK